MTLDEAISHAKEQACKLGCTECGKEHEQLAEWLEELKLWRNINESQTKHRIARYFMFTKDYNALNKKYEAGSQYKIITIHDVDYAVDGCIVISKVDDLLLKDIGLVDVIPFW